jgi:hypothetical protein
MEDNAGQCEFVVAGGDATPLFEETEGFLTALMPTMPDYFGISFPSAKCGLAPVLVILLSAILSELLANTG